MKIVKIMFDGCYTDKGERIEHDAKTWGIFEAGLRGLGDIGDGNYLGLVLVKGEWFADIKNKKGRELIRVKVEI